MKPDVSFLRIWMSTMFFAFPVIFFTLFMFSKQRSKMIKDMTGDNSRWDWSEIWQAASLFMAIGSWWAIMCMLFLSGAFNSHFPSESWIIVGVSTAGSAGIEALIIYVKGKYGSNENKN